MAPSRDGERGPNATRRARRKSRPVFADEPIQDGQFDMPETILPDEDLARRERMRAFGRLIDRLGEKKRTVFILHELEGMPPLSRSAKVVGAPVLTVRTRLFYAFSGVSSRRRAPLRGGSR